MKNQRPHFLIVEAERTRRQLKIYHGASDIYSFLYSTASEVLLLK